METDKLIKVCGSITKKESLINITNNVLEHSWVAEANLPYANYYGHVPEKAKPNSLFLFTERFYTLEEVLRFSQNIDTCYTKNVNMASAIFEYQDKQFPAIRIKNFPNYLNLHLLQDCFAKQGVKFALNKQIRNEVEAIISKCFEFTELEEDIYLDNNEENKGYILVKNRIIRNDFEDVISIIKHNSNCQHFDAVAGGFIINSQAIDMIRVYSEGLNLELLKCIKTQLKMRFSS